MTRRPGRPKSAHPKGVVAFRLDAELLARIDAYAERLRQEAAWASPTRTDAARYLLTYALDRLKAETKGKRSK